MADIGLAGPAGLGEAGAARLPRRARIALGSGRLRLILVGFALLYLAILVRLFLLAALPPDSQAHGGGNDTVAAARPDILDRNGEILATDIRTASLFAEPRKIIDVDEAVEQLTAALPELNAKEVRTRLSSDKGFIWLKRELTLPQQAAIHRLGLPGVGFLPESRRVYPMNRMGSHVLGHVNIDNQGIAGIEKHLDSDGLGALHAAGLAGKNAALAPATLSLDMRVQFALRDELAGALERYKAKAAVGVVLDVRTGEVLAMNSLPDYDPNDPKESLDPDRMNRLTAGVFEMGSTFKSFTVAMALDSGKVKLSDNFDARVPLRFGRHTINDFHGKHRVLSVPEVFIYSSNIGTARMAMVVGVEGQKAFLKRLGLLDRLRTELPESAEPLFPKKWTEINLVTISFGHGLSVSPLQTAVAAAALVNGGFLIPPTLFPRGEAEAKALAKRVLRPETSEAVRSLMRLNVEKGSGKRAEVPGYRVGGKTGTAEKVENGRYSHNKLFTTFIATFPTDDPRYLVLICLDEPKRTLESGGAATAAVNAAPTAGRVIARIAPMLSVAPRFAETEKHASGL